MDLRSLGKQHRDSIVFGLILIGSLGSLMIQSSRFTSVPEQVGMTVAGAIEGALIGTRDFVTNTIRSVSELRDLRREYDVLLEKLDESQQQFQSMEALQHENRILREALAYSENSDFTSIPAKIIGKDPGVIFTSLMINKGRRNGIREGMTVVAYQDGQQGLVGRIIEAGPITSLVRPLVDPMSYVAARLSRTRYEGLLRGLGSGSETLIMEYLDRESRNQINVGDEIITSGLNSAYPVNLRIGRVTGILGTSYETSLQLEILPFISFTRLEQVFVLQRTGPAELQPVSPADNAPLFIPGPQAAEDEE